VQGNVFALVQIFNAIPSPSFSAPAELRMINPNHWSLSCVNQSLKPLELSCSIHPRRPTGLDSLEVRFRKAGLGWVGVFNVAPTSPCTSITILFPVSLGQSQKNCHRSKKSFPKGLETDDWLICASACLGKPIVRGSKVGMLPCPHAWVHALPEKGRQ
jgi:hypothetical protein